MQNLEQYKIPIVEGINDRPLPPNFNNNKRGPNGSYLTEKYNNFVDAVSNLKIQELKSIEFVIANADGLVANSYHTEVGRGGYFPTESGTSESQFLVIAGVAKALEATNYYPLSLLLSFLTKNIVKILYFGEEPPAVNNISQDHIWIAHWLFNVKGDFRSEQYYLNSIFKFNNGEAVINKDFYGDKLKNVYKILSLDHKLSWENPFSSLVEGTEYEIEQIIYEQDQVRVIASEKINGDYYILYSSKNGALIKKSECFDAWPSWRPLDVGEKVSAIDAIEWAERAFRYAYNATFYDKFWEMREATLASAPFAYAINDQAQYIYPLRAKEVEAYPYYVYIDRPNTVLRRASDFSIVVDLKEVPSGNDGGVVVIERANEVNGPSSLLTISDEETFRVIASSSAPITFGVWLDDDPNLGYNPLNRFETYITLSGTSKLETFILNLEDFKNGDQQPLTPRGGVLRAGFTFFQQIGPNTINFYSFEKTGQISYPYIPGAQPFTLNTQYGRPLFWRGTLYTGYQAPIMWKLLNNEEAFNNCLQFIEDAQIDYTLQNVNNTVGPFSPVFYLDRPDNLEYGPANTWGWNAPDPNTFWGGFQYRTAKSLSHIIEEFESAKADEVLNKFLIWLDEVWEISTPQRMAPLNFPQFEDPNNITPDGLFVWDIEPHMAALIGESALISYNHSSYTENQAIFLSLIKKSFDHIMVQRISSGEQRGSFMGDSDNPHYYGYWHGEIMQFLSKLLIDGNSSIWNFINISTEELRLIIIEAGEWILRHAAV